MAAQPETIPVPLNVVQATAEAVAKLPAGQYADLFVAWRNLIEQHNREAQERREAEARAETPLLGEDPR